MITGAPWPTPTEVTVRVLGIQAKLHRWASEDPARRFDDLFNLVVDPAVLLMAWRRVRSNRGARTAGVDGSTAHYIEAVRGVESFLAELRADLVAQQFVPLPAWERLIPKSGGRVRRLGIRISRPQRSKSSMSGRTSRRRAGHGRINSTNAVLLHGCENEVALPVAFVKFPCGARPVLDRMRFSARVHSRWAQSVKDLPYGAPMLVRWDKRRFVCDQVECPRRTFTEVTDQLGRRRLHAAAAPAAGAGGLARPAVGGRRRPGIRGVLVVGEPGADRPGRRRARPGPSGGAPAQRGRDPGAPGPLAARGVRLAAQRSVDDQLRRPRSEQSRRPARAGTRSVRGGGDRLAGPAG